MSRPDAVRVTIFNQNYSLRASDDQDPDRVEALARNIDDLMRSIASKGGNLDATRIAVLACLHLADQLQTVQDDLENFRDNVNSKAREFSLLLDEALETQAPESQRKSQAAVEKIEGD